MRRALGHIALGGAAFAALGLALSPALGAASDFLKARPGNPVSLNDLGSITSFTPTTKDERLAAAYAKAAITSDGAGFRFTPTSGSLSGQRSITVLVRADGAKDRADRAASSLGIAPVAFSLNVSSGWRKFALPDSVGTKELDPVPVKNLGAASDFSIDKQKKSRFSTDVLVDGRREPGEGGSAINATKPYSLDMASSYSLTRNINVTAGVRYRGGASARLAPLTDDRQDNQAVYFGTVFKF